MVAYYKYHHDVCRWTWVTWRSEWRGKGGIDKRDKGEREREDRDGPLMNVQTPFCIPMHMRYCHLVDKYSSLFFYLFACSWSPITDNTVVLIGCTCRNTKFLSPYKNRTCQVSTPFEHFNTNVNFEKVPSHSDITRMVWTFPCMYLPIFSVHICIFFLCLILQIFFMNAP